MIRNYVFAAVFLLTLVLSFAANSANDPYFSDQNELYQVNAPAAWSISQGQGAVIAVIDSGILPHPDLNGQLLQGYDFVDFDTNPNDPLSTCGDPQPPGCPGCSPQSQQPSQGSTTSSTRPSHGLMVAGKAAAIRNNSEGIVGASPLVQILPIRAGGCQFSSQAISQAIRWAAGGQVAGVPTNSSPAEVINLSIQKYESCPTNVQSAIDYAESVGTVVVAAAGNQSTSSSNVYPANCDNTITVGAAASSYYTADYTNYAPPSYPSLEGPGADSVFVYAPGGAQLGFDVAWGMWSTTNTGTGYAEIGGTSFAAPLVSAVVALMQSHAARPPSVVRDVIKDSGTPIMGANSKDFVGVLIDAQAALQNIPQCGGGYCYY